MADYQQDIAENKAEIKELKAKIKKTEAKDPRSEDDKADIIRWSQEIEKLELKNEILELKNELLELEKKLEKEKDKNSARDLRNEIHRKKKELEVTRQVLLSLATKFLGPEKSVEDLADGVQELNLEEIPDKIFKELEKLPVPSKFMEENIWSEWNRKSPADQDLFLLYTHRPPATTSGRQHVSMFSAALGQLYDDVRNRDFSVTLDDMKKAAELCEISAPVYKDEAARSEKLRPYFSEYFTHSSLLYQNSVDSTGQHNHTSSDSGVQGNVVIVGGLKPTSIELEFKNGLFGDAMMQAVGYYLIHHKQAEFLERTCPSVLFCILGPFALLFCAVFTGKCFIVDPLIALPLLPTPNDLESLAAVARVLAATKKAAIAITDDYKTKRNMHQQGFPYKTACKHAKDEGEVITFKYTDHLGDPSKDKVFTADELSGEKVINVVDFQSTTPNTLDLT